MRIVAIGALDEAFVHAMVERHGELRFLLEMAGIAELGLRFDEQEVCVLAVMRRVAGSAGDIVLRMHGIDGIHVFRAGGMAGKAAGIDFPGRVAWEDKDFCLVTAPGYVRPTGAVAALASLVRWATLDIERRLPVRTFLPAIVNFFMARLADFSSHEIGRRGRSCGSG